MMSSYFTTAVTLTNVLFEGWTTDSWKGVLLASAITCIMTIIFEGLKIVKAYIVIRRVQSPLTYGNAGSTEEPAQQETSSEVNLLSSLKIPVNIQQIKQRKMILFSLESLLHLFNFFYGYVIMLLVMTFSVWFLVAVLVGSGIGFFVFNAVSQNLADKYSVPKKKETQPPCCGEGPTQRAGSSSVNNTAREYEERDSLLQPASTRNYQSISSSNDPVTVASSM